MEKKFNKVKYDIEYRKKHKKSILIDLNIDEYEELQKLLHIANISKTQLFRNAIADLRKSLEK